MKMLYNYLLISYVVATIVCLCVMIIVDYILGAEAQYLNAWVIVNKLFGRKIGIGDCLALRQFGIAGSTVLMLVINTIFGITSIQIIKLFIRLFHE